MVLKIVAIPSMMIEMPKRMSFIALCPWVPFMLDTASRDDLKILFIKFQRMIAQNEREEPLKQLLYFVPGAEVQLGHYDLHEQVSRFDWWQVVSDVQVIPANRAMCLFMFSRFSSFSSFSLASFNSGNARSLHIINSRL